MFNILKIYNMYDMFLPEDIMKTHFSEKNRKNENTIPENVNSRSVDRTPYLRDLPEDDLERMIRKNRKFFRISAELSVNLN